MSKRAVNLLRAQMGPAMDLVVRKATTSGTLFARGYAATAPSLVQKFPAPAVPGAGAAQTLTIANLLTGILHDDPEGNSNWTLPTAALAVAGVAGVAVGDCIDFVVINDATSAADEKITLLMGTDGTAVGLMVVDSQLVAGIRGHGSGAFRIRFTGVASGSEAYVCYRIG
jgi:hypothetical protein